MPRWRTSCSAPGHAYKCFATPEELGGELREEQRAKKQPMRYDGRWRDRDPSEAAETRPSSSACAPAREGETTHPGSGAGPVTVRNAELDDMILLRSDGTPTYMLAVVVDDHDMGVTHVIRGDDHLNNAFRQLGIIARDGLARADLCPYPADPRRRRRQALQAPRRASGVDAYRDELGMLPEAVEQLSAAARLGPWRRGVHHAASAPSRWFDLAGVGKSPSRFDLKKLENLNGHYIREARCRPAGGAATRASRRMIAARCDDEPPRAAASQHAVAEAARPRTLESKSPTAPLFLFAPAPA